MAYRGMSDRFEQKMDELYGKFSAKDGKYAHPLIEIKPNDPAKDDTRHDTRMMPGESALRDYNRVYLFLRSPSGRRFMLQQAELQSANTFSETRLYNPLFPFGRLAPNWIRIQRPLGTAKGASSSGTAVASSFARGFIKSPNVGAKSPGSDSTIGSAGRLQKETSKKAVNRALGRSGPTGLLTLIPPNKITRVISSVQNILQTGILGVDQRPELDIDGQYFSIVQWAGFSRTMEQPNNFVKAGAAARKGDIKGTIVNIGKGVINSLKKRLLGTKGAPIPTAPRANRDDMNRPELNGLRYFIVNATDADRYLQNSVTDGKPTVEYLNKRPYQLEGKSVLLDSLYVKTPSVNKTTAKSAKEKIALQLQSKKKKVLTKIGNFIKKNVNALVGSSVPTIAGVRISFGATNPITGRLKKGALINNSSAPNPAEERMLFGTLSLASRYENADGDLAFFKEESATQNDIWLNSLKKLKTEHSFNIGMKGGLSAGTKIVDDHGIFASQRTKVEKGRYFFDGAIEIDPIVTNEETHLGDKPIDPYVKKSIRGAYKDVIDFMFHDYVNNKIIPFRASLADIKESISPRFEGTSYIGRSEQAISYAGAQRGVNFTFYIQAASENEIDFIWKKINYLTGLCFPSAYANGFMVPPFLQLTIGNLYTDQPGYIQGLNYDIDTNTSWDIDEDKQIPMGITVNCQYSIIEKRQMQVGSDFYNFGTLQDI